MDDVSRSLVDLTLEAATFIFLVLFGPTFDVIPTPRLVPRSALIVFVFKQNIKHPPLLNQHRQDKGVVSFSFSSLLAFNQAKTHIAVSSQRRSLYLPLFSTLFSNQQLSGQYITYIIYILSLPQNIHPPTIQLHSQLAQTFRNVRHHVILTVN
jgi:hypothetical protein